MPKTNHQRLGEINQKLARFDGTFNEWCNLLYFANILDVPLEEFSSDFLPILRNRGFPHPAAQKGGYTGPAEYHEESGLMALKAFVEEAIGSETKSNDRVDHYAAGYAGFEVGVVHTKNIPAGDFPLPLIGARGESRRIDMLPPGESIEIIDRMEKLREVLMLFPDKDLAAIGVTIQRIEGEWEWLAEAITKALLAEGRDKVAKTFSEGIGSKAVTISVSKQFLMHLSTLITA